MPTSLKLLHNTASWVLQDAHCCTTIPPITGVYLVAENYSIIFDTTPAPTVRPPSRMANFTPFSIAIGDIKVMVI